MSCPFYKG